MQIPRALAAALTAYACAPGVAQAIQTPELHAGFSPNRLGASTTISFSFTIKGPGGEIPSPLTGLDLHLPAGIGFATSTLGLAVCDPADLIVEGADGCPENARIGYGTASAAVPYGPEVVTEDVQIAAFMGTEEAGHLTMLFFAEGWYPVFAQVVFAGQLLDDTGPFGGRIEAALPIVPSVPGGPNVAVTHFQSTIGPSRITYYRRSGGRRIAFHPRGVTVPASCPRGGFRFAADFSFEDGGRARATTLVRCPARAGAQGAVASTALRSAGRPQG